jgi:hypothetical protein
VSVSSPLTVTGPALVLSLWHARSNRLVAGVLLWSSYLWSGTSV